MITLQLTRTQCDDILHAVGQLYMEYDDNLGAQWNDSIKRYNDEIDALRITIKKQLQEQE